MEANNFPSGLNMEQLAKRLDMGTDDTAEQMRLLRQLLWQLATG